MNSDRPTFRKDLMAALCVAILLLCAISARGTEISPPVNLGATGYVKASLDLRLYLWNGTTWAAQSVTALTLDELGDGEYTVGELPSASGTNRYSLHLALAADPGIELAAYTYGAVPGTEIVWRQEISIPSQPTVFKTGDTYGSVQIQVLSNLPSALCDMATTATFALFSRDSGATVFSGRSATISDCAVDSGTGTYGALFTYSLQSGDTDTAGRYLGEFQVCYSVDSCHTMPADDRLQITIREAFD